MALVAKHKKNLFKKEFIGRLEYSNKFHNIFDDIKRFNVLAFYGMGGIGKTSLLKHLHTQSMKKDSTIAVFINLELYKSPEDFYQYLKHEFIKYRIQTTYFDIAFLIYWHKKNPHIELTKQQLPFFEEGSVIADALSLAEGLATGLPVLSGITSLLYKHHKKIKLTYKLSNENDIKSEIESLDELEPNEIENLFQKFFEYDVREYLSKTKKRIVFFLDTYESLYRNLNYTQHLQADEWIREFILSLDNTKSLFVIAGRDSLLWSDEEKEWENFLRQYKIDELNNLEAEQLLIKAGIEDKAIRQEILTNSKVPFYLEQSVELYRNIKNPKVRDFKGVDTKTTFSRLLQYSDQHETNLLKHLSVTRYFTDELYNELIKQFNLTSIHIETISRKLSIHNEDGVFQMHKLMQESLLSNTDLEIQTNVNEFLFNFYEKKFYQNLNISTKNIIKLFREALFHKSQLQKDDFLVWFLKKIEIFKMIGYTTTIPLLFDEAIALLPYFKSDLLLNLILFYIEEEELLNAKSLMQQEYNEGVVDDRKNLAFYLYIKARLEDNKIAAQKLFSRALKECNSNELLIKINFELKNYEIMITIIQNEKIDDIIVSEYYCKIANINQNLTLNQRLSILSVADKKLTDYSYAIHKRATIFFEEAQAFYLFDEFSNSLKKLNKILLLIQHSNYYHKKSIEKLYSLIAEILMKQHIANDISKYPTNAEKKQLILSIIKKYFQKKKSIDEYLFIVENNLNSSDAVWMRYEIANLYLLDSKTREAQQIFLKLLESNLTNTNMQIKIYTKLIISASNDTEIDNYILKLKTYFSDEFSLSSIYKTTYEQLLERKNFSTANNILLKNITILESLYVEDDIKYYKHILHAYFSAIKYYKNIDHNQSITYEYIDKYIKISKNHNDKQKTIIGNNIFIKFSIETNNINKLIKHEEELTKNLQSNSFNSILDGFYLKIIENESDTKKIQTYYHKQLIEREKEGCETYKLSRSYFYIGKFYKEKLNDTKMYIKYLKKAIEKDDHLNYSLTLQQYVHLIETYIQEGNQTSEIIENSLKYAREKNIIQVDLVNFLRYLQHIVYILPNEEKILILKELDKIPFNLLEKNLDNKFLLKYLRNLNNKEYQYLLKQEDVLSHLKLLDNVYSRMFEKENNFFKNNAKSIVTFYIQFAEFISEKNIKGISSKFYIDKVRELIVEHESYDEIRNLIHYINSFYLYKKGAFELNLLKAFEIEIKYLRKNLKIERNTNRLTKIYQYLQDELQIFSFENKDIDYISKSLNFFTLKHGVLKSDKTKIVYDKIYFYKNSFENSNDLDSRLSLMEKMASLNMQLENPKTHHLSSCYNTLSQLYFQNKQYKESCLYMKKNLKLFDNSFKRNLSSILSLYQNIFNSLDDRSVKVHFLHKIIKIKNYLQLTDTTEKIQLYREMLLLSFDLPFNYEYTYSFKLIQLYKNTEKFDQEEVYNLYSRLIQINQKDNFKIYLHQEIEQWKNNKRIDLEPLYSLLYNIYLTREEHKKLIKYIMKNSINQTEDLYKIIDFYSKKYPHEMYRYYAKIVELKEFTTDQDKLSILYIEAIKKFENIYYNKELKQMYYKKLFVLEGGTEYILEHINNKYNQITTKIDILIDSKHDINSINEPLKQFKLFVESLKI